MLDLYLLRHGKACKNADSGRDYDRELNKKGTAQCNQIGYILKERHISIDEIIFSSAARTKQTAMIVNHFLGIDTVQQFEELYLAPQELIVEMIAEHANQPSLLYVGHNFGISDIVGYLTDDPMDLATSQLVHIQFELDQWSELSRGTGTFVETIIPDVIAF